MATTSRALSAFPSFSWGIMDVPDTPRPHGTFSERREVLRQANPELAGRAFQGAQLLSPARLPLPRCHPGTRTSLIEEIIQQTCQTPSEDGEDYPLLWIYGPAGAGKTALAQTFGESIPSYALGAAFFISRTRNHNDPSRFWISICHQLMSLGSDAYNSLVNQRIRKNRAILEADIRTQFKELILRPLRSYRLLCSRLVVIIDGLDECDGEEEQCQIIECICDNLRRLTPLPIRWVVFSRPEPHLKRVFGVAGSQGLCWMKEIVIDDPITLRDVRTFLQDGFHRIATKYRDIVQGLARQWPKPADLEKIFKASSGFFVYAATILKFVGDPISASPVSQLQIVVDFLDGSPVAPGQTNPLAYIDNLYRELIKKSPHELLPVTLRILGACAVCPPLPALYFAHLIDIDIQVFYNALVSLHSLIAVPSVKNMAEEPLRYYHASFPEFLTDPYRSETLAQNPCTSRLQLAESCFRVIGGNELVYSQSVPACPLDEDEEFSSPLSISYNVYIGASTHVWDICAQIPNPVSELLRLTLSCFDFRYLRLVTETIPPFPFAEFLRWFYRCMQKFPDLMQMAIVRTHPQFEMDNYLIDKIQPISQPFDLRSRGEESELTGLPRYVLIGSGEQTIVVLLTHEAVMAYSAEDIDGL